MSVLILDKSIEKRLRSQRARTGADRYDEVWNGIYVMSPMPDDEHQGLIAKLTAVFQEVIGWPGLGEVRPGVNVSDREKGWKRNYRCPDVAVMLRDGQAKNCGTHWIGPVDFVVEILSRGDRSRKKLPFYSSLGVRELLLIDRKPWSLQLYRLTAGELLLVAESATKPSNWVKSEVLPFDFSLARRLGRLEMNVRHQADHRVWKC